MIEAPAMSDIAKLWTDIAAAWDDQDNEAALAELDEFFQTLEMKAARRPGHGRDSGRIDIEN
jgi:hypothetical protein